MLNRTQSPSIQEIDSITLPRVEELKLDNGLPVYAINEGAQDIVKLEFIFRAGKWYEEQNLVADLTNRMLREGTRTHTARQLADAFEFYGSNFNTSAGFETAGVTFYCLTKHLNVQLPILKSIFTESVFPQQEFETICRNKQQKLLVNLQKNDFVANRIFVDALYGQQHPYGRITKPEHFGALSVDDLKNFYRTHYSSNNCFIILSGKWDNSLIAELNRNFGGSDWSGAEISTSLTHPITPGKEKVLHVEKPDAVQSAVVIGQRSITKTHPDFRALSVLNTIFGGYFGSRLMSNIREEKGYTYGIYSSFVSYTHDGFLEIGAEVGKAVCADTLAQIELEINALRNELVEADELQTVKNYMSGKILRSVDGPMKFSETLKGLLLYGQDLSYITAMLQTVRSTTAEELRELARRYLVWDEMYKVTVG